MENPVLDRIADDVASETDEESATTGIKWYIVGMKASQDDKSFVQDVSDLL